ncbi:MAG: hypothetical protein ACSHW7_04585 [Patiriisocius sp.]|uniref:hypothetical protein n=1 Tax=Patiriisocius sp. TaxID=2822396 RepID=UPI003EF27551
MKTFKLLLFFAVFIISFSAFAQNATAKKIDVNRDIDLVEVYKEYVAEGYGTPAIYKKLANGTYFNSDYLSAKKWYEKLFETERPINATHKKRYEQTLKALKIDPATSVYLGVAESNK